MSNNDLKGVDIPTLKRIGKLQSANNGDRLESLPCSHEEARHVKDLIANSGVRVHGATDERSDGITFMDIGLTEIGKNWFENLP